jgi:signal transduction histidine kinase/ligand-binding sensor domain-containing protein/DNA-binding response OmpR family regulator
MTNFVSISENKKTMKRISISVILFFICCFVTEASFFRNYQVENGLSHNSVWTVAQDSEGFMWFGTNDGLNRFDGKTFKIYRKHASDSTSIGHNFIHSIKEDSQKRLLIGTRNGLYLYNKGMDDFKYIPLSGSRKNEVNVNDIMEDLHGNIWVACHGQGLYKLNPDLTVERHYIHTGKKACIPSNYLWTVACDHLGNLWIGTAGTGLAHFDPKNERFTSIAGRPGLKIEGQSIYSIYCDNDNSLWIGTFTNGLFKYNYITGETKHYLENTGSVKAIGAYSEDELIMGSEKGLILFNKAGEDYTIVRDNYSDNATDNSIFSIARDKEGAFWIGTYFGGVNYFSPSTNNFLYYNNLLENPPSKYIVSSIAEEQRGSILISTHNNNVIYRFHPSSRKIEKAFEMDYNNVQSLLIDGDKLYASVYGRGVNVISLKSGKIVEKLSINTIEGKSIFKLGGGIMFALEEGGCIYMTVDGGKKKLDKLSRILVADVAQDANGTIWFATYSNGFFAWKKDGEWNHYSSQTDPPSFASNSLNCMLPDKNNLWIGTKDVGVVLFDIEQNKIVRNFDASHGIPSDIYSMLKDDDGSIWASTKEGIVKIAGEKFEIKLFGYIGREMQYNYRCALHSSENQLYFGGTNGFIQLNPKNLLINENIPNVVVTGFKISNKEVVPGGKSSPLKKSLEETKEIVLKRSQSNFSFDFVSLSFVFPETNKYAYMLEGFDKEWNYVSENTAQYMNISPGKYVFKVKGSNNDGVWNENSTNIIVRVKPPFWLSLYMIIVYIILFGSLGIFAVKWYLRRLDRQNKEKQYKYKVAQEKEIYESKINFFTNIAHEIRTPLSLITAPLENIILSKEGSEQMRKNLSTIERNTNRLLDLVNQLLYFRKIENDMFLMNLRYQNIVKIIRKVYEQYAPEARSKDIKISLNIPDKSILSYIDSEALYKIVSNLISNAIKFSRSIIEIELKTENEMLYLTVKDDGTGIKDEYQNKIFEPFYQVEVIDNYNNKGSGLGLSLSKSLAQKLRGDILLRSEYGKGSVFTLELPILVDESIPEAEEKKAEAAQESEQFDLIEPAELESNVAVLIVEDNEELRSFTKECLSEQYTVYEAENGIKALELLETNIIDIIISDILMPGMDGLEFCSELKGNTAYSHLPLILLSAKTDTATKIEGLKKGADVYMEKPFSIEQLKAQINSIIDNKANIRKKFVESPLQYFKRNTDNSENAKFIKKLNAFILDNMSDENFSIDNLSSEFAISRTNFQKKIKNITGLTPNDYIKLIRLNKSAELLSTGKYRINEVCFLVGFNTPSYFSRCFFDHFGKLPKDFMH